jgi:hypothetical protein
MNALSKTCGKIGQERVLPMFWRAIDALSTFKGSLSVSHHHAFDKLFVMLAHSRTIFPGGFFADGVSSFAPATCHLCSLFVLFTVGRYERSIVFG